MKRSAAICKWNLDLSFFTADESCSFPGENSMLPTCKIAANTRNMDSW